MRTTLTLDSDVARLLGEEAHRRRRPFKEVVNDAIRRGLSPRQTGKGGKYKVQVHSARLRAGIDRAGFNKLADESEDEAVLRKVGQKQK